jgi:hypothetical protein
VQDGHLPRHVNCRALIAWATLMVVSTSCRTISTYDQAAYDKVTGAKAEVLALMDKATSSYDSNVKAIQEVSLTVNKAYEYDRGRTLNQVTIEQWQLLLNPKGDVFGGFLRMWKDRGQLHSGLVEDKKNQIGQAFDQIIQLENGKIKAQ